MKKVFLLFAVSIFSFACSPNADVNSHSTMNHDGMNHNTTSHTNEPINHGMDHSQMKSAPNAASAPYDLQFIDTMIAHHQSAIDMANLAATNTNNAGLKKFAVQIFADQTREINQLKDWREKWYAGAPSALNMEMPGMRESMRMEMTALNAARDKDFDAEFIRLMIPHHEGAVTMARDALTKAERPEIRTLANQIIKAQEAEIKMLRDWQTEWAK
jgi:uncharacterized protein (DUF305 family)